MTGRAKARAAVAGALVLAVAAIYTPTLGHGFVDLDDSEYVYENPRVSAGLEAGGVRWAFTTFHAANWHPLTWLSHMLDVELFGAAPAGHHATSVGLHALNSVLVFLGLEALTLAFWPSAAVAALFAVHPLRVESVAWVAERKDLLCALFGLLACGAYVNWARKGGGARYLAVAGLFALALMSKPMLVTLPVLLLLVDYWPLGRLRRARDLWLRSREKLPLFALSTLSSWITYVAQAGGGATAAAERFPLGDRLLNAALSYVAYLGQTVWPRALAAFYPHPNAHGARVALVPALGAAFGLVAATWIVVARRARRPWLVVGWLWFAVALVPVIGVVQVGSQARADRYTYLPLVGIFVIAAWGASAACARWRVPSGAVAAFAGAALLAYGATARAQVASWRDSETLYRRALAVTQSNFLAWNNLGVAQLERGEPSLALESFERAVRIKADYASAWYNAGVALNRLDQPVRAVAAYRESLRLDARNADGWANLGASLRMLGVRDESIASYRRALALAPDHPVARAGLSALGVSPPP